LLSFQRHKLGGVEPIVVFSAFQKSTVFEKVTKHRETVAEGNVFETDPPSVTDVWC
jgi:hypothetical protein